jgi:hypothetical protein
MEATQPIDWAILYAVLSIPFAVVATVREYREMGDSSELASAFLTGLVFWPFFLVAALAWLTPAGRRRLREKRRLREAEAALERARNDARIAELRMEAQRIEADILAREIAFYESGTFEQSTGLRASAEEPRPDPRYL